MGNTTRPIFSHFGHRRNLATGLRFFTPIFIASKDPEGFYSEPSSLLKQKKFPLATGHISPRERISPLPPSEPGAEAFAGIMRSRFCHGWSGPSRSGAKEIKKSISGPDQPWLGGFQNPGHPDLGLLPQAMGRRSKIFSCDTRSKDGRFSSEWVKPLRPSRARFWFSLGCFGERRDVLEEANP